MFDILFMQIFIQRITSYFINIINLFFFNNLESFSNSSHIKHLMKAFRADDYGHESNTNTGDIGYGWIHYGLIRQQKPNRVLCIGSRHGYIPAILAQACKDNGFGRVDFVDAGYDLDDAGGWTGEGYWKTLAGKNSFINFGLGNFISLFVMTNSDFINKYQSNYYDYIYIDGDHSLKGIILDFKLFWPKLNKNGYMLFHDVCVKGIKPEGVYGVWKFWELLKKRVSGIEISFLGSGLGIIQKK